MKQWFSKLALLVIYHGKQKIIQIHRVGYSQQNELNKLNQKSLLKKFTIILPDLRAGGAQRVALNIASVIDSNINVELILLDKVGEYSNIIPKNVSVINLSKKRVIYSIIPLIKLLNKLKPDIIFSTLGHVNIILLIIKPFVHKKSQIWIREANMPSLSIPNWDKSLIINYIYK